MSDPAMGGVILIQLYYLFYQTAANKVNLHPLKYIPHIIPIVIDLLIKNGF